MSTTEYSERRRVKAVESSGWCETTVNVDEMQFMWVINNFSFCSEKPGEALESTVFTSPTSEGLQWRIQFYPTGNNTDNQDYVSVFLHLVNCEKPMVKTDFRFSLVDKDNREVNERRTTDKWHFFQGRQSGFPKFVKKEVLFDPTNGMLTNDKLRIVCTIKSATGDVNRIDQDGNYGKAPNLLGRMSEDFAWLIDNMQYSDVSLEVSDSNDHFSAHKNILAARSPVFAAMFEHNMRERFEGVVRIQNVDSETLKSMLIFIYTGKILVHRTKMGQLLRAADQYALLGLKETCEQVLCKAMTIDDAADLLLLAELHNAEQLKRRALTFVRIHLKEVVETPGFKNVAETCPSLMADIIKNMSLT